MDSTPGAATDGSGRSPGATIAIAAGLFAAVLALRLVIDSPSDATLVLLVVPIALVALELGTRAGLLTAALAFAVFVTWSALSDADTSLAGYLARAGAYFPIAAIVGTLASRMREASDAVRDLYEQAPCGYHSLDGDGTFVAVNRTELDWLGYGREEVIGRLRFADLLTPTSLEDFKRAFPRFIEVGSIRDAEFDLIRKDGSLLPVVVNATAVKDANGELLHTRSTLFDISERRREERKSAHVAAIVESSDDAIIGLALDGTITSWNRGAGRLYGYSADEVIGKPVSILTPGDRPDEVGSYLRAVVGGQRVERLETQGIRKGGKPADVSLTVSPIQESGGAVVGASVVATDIGDRRRTERHLAAQHSAGRALAQSAGVDEAIAAVLRAIGEGTGWMFGAVWAVDADDSSLRCRATWIAPAYRNRRIAPFEPGAGFPLPDGAAGERRRMPRWIEDVAACELPGCGSDAADHGLRTSMWLPIYGGPRAFGAIQLFSRELLFTDEEMLELMQAVAIQLGQFIERMRASEDAERIKDEFFALISHELRTPLTSIIGYTELLSEMEGDRLSDQGRNFVEVIDRNARREIRLVRDLLLLVRMESGTFTLEPGTADLAQIVAESAEAATPRAADKQIEVVVDAEQVPAYGGDPHRLAQVVDNLLSNAIKFTPEDGRVEVRLSHHDGKAAIEVADSGMGIPPDEQGRLFERMYRATSATEQHIPGVGLGLTIVKAIVEAHGGRIGLESEVGTGTTFRVELPLRAPHSNGSDPHPARPRPRQASE